MQAVRRGARKHAETHALFLSSSSWSCGCQDGGCAAMSVANMVSGSFCTSGKCLSLTQHATMAIGSLQTPYSDVVESLYTCAKDATGNHSPSQDVTFTSSMLSTLSCSQFTTRT